MPKSETFEQKLARKLDEAGQTKKELKNATGLTKRAIYGEKPLTIEEMAIVAKRLRDPELMAECCNNCPIGKVFPRCGSVGNLAQNAISIHQVIESLNEKMRMLLDIAKCQNISEAMKQDFYGILREIKAGRQAFEALEMWSMSELGIDEKKTALVR